MMMIVLSADPVAIYFSISACRNGYNSFGMHFNVSKYSV